MAMRQRHLRRAGDLWTSFLQKLQALEQLSPAETAQFQDLLQLSEDDSHNNNDTERQTHTSSSRSSFRPPPLPDRDAKIARYRAKQQVAQEQERLRALRERRRRLGVADADELDGHDAEGLDRTLALAQLQLATAEALEEWESTVRELPMIARMVRSQRERQGDARYGYWWISSSQRRRAAAARAGA